MAGGGSLCHSYPFAGNWLPDEVLASTHDALAVNETESGTMLDLGCERLDALSWWRTFSE
jgi:hypothetical protein